MYDLIIIGGGPAGSAAGVYAARKRLNTLQITKDFGGQSNVSPDVQNWIGTVSISGTDLAKSFKEHVKAYADDVLEIQEGDPVTDIKKDGDTVIVTVGEDTYEAKSVLVASGAHRRKLKVPGAEEYENRGVVYCASCDGPLFAEKDVAVIGGGNAGFETAAQLLAYTNSVTLLHKNEEFKADEITVNKVLQNPKMTAITNALTQKIEGDAMVTSLTYEDTETGEEHTLDVEGVFVEIGLVPNTDISEGLLDMDDYNRIKIDPWTQRTSVDGIWAAGDCTNVHFHQNNIAAGDAVKAIEDIYQWLQHHKDIEAAKEAKETATTQKATK